MKEVLTLEEILLLSSGACHKGSYHIPACKDSLHFIDKEKQLTLCYGLHVKCLYSPVYTRELAWLPANRLWERDTILVTLIHVWVNAAIDL